MLSNQYNVSQNSLSYSKFNDAAKINHFLFKKYFKFEFSYSRICINQLISHEKCRIVAKFKDYLIFDDNTEFLHEFCNKNKLFPRLKYIFNFYNSYSRIYPNYLIIPENKFLYKNIRKKQRLIDEENEIKFSTPKNKKSSKNQKIYLKTDEINDLIFFKKSIIDSINKHNRSSNINTGRNSNNIINNSNELNNIISSTASNIKNRNHNLDDLIENKRNNLKGIQLKENTFNSNSLNTQSSSFIKNNFYEDNTRSKASLTEIINLIDGKNINIKKYKKNVSSNKSNIKKIDKIKTTKNQRFKFLMLDIDYIKKNIKTYKPKLYNYNNVKTEYNKASPKKKESINNKNKTLKNNNQNIIFHKQTVSCLEDISQILINKNKKYKRKKLSHYSKLNYKKINSKEPHINCFEIKTVTNFGNLYSKKNKTDEFKSQYNNNNKYKMRRKSDSIIRKNLIFSSTISTNYSVNFGNTCNKNNNMNNNLKYNLDNKNVNENKKNYVKNKNKHNIIKSIETLISMGERKRQIYKEKYLNKVFKLETDSKSTKNSLNKNNNHAFSCIEKILTQIKKTIKKNSTKSKSKNKSKKKINNSSLSSLQKKYYTNYSNKEYDFKNKISSYDCKPFPEYYQKKLYFTKIQLTKQKMSTVAKNNRILDFFTSKDFYNLKINNILRNSTNINNTNINNNILNNNIKRACRSINKNNEKSKVYTDLNMIDSNSFILKTFNNENNNNNNQYEKNKTKKYKFNFNHLNHIDIDKLKEKCHKYLYGYNSKNMSYDKSDNYCFLIKHKKNNTTNICKNIEEINNLKNKKDILKKNKRNKITLLNYLNNNNMKLQLNYKTPSKNLIKSLQIKNNRNNNCTNYKNEDIKFRDTLNINSQLINLKN